MPDRHADDHERPSSIDPDFLPLATAASLAHAWERLLAERYPGTSWTLEYDPDPGRARQRIADAQEAAAGSPDDGLAVQRFASREAS